MQININLTEEQIKALLTEYTSIEEFCQRVVENRANRIMMDIVKKHADNLEGVTAEEQKTISFATVGKIITDAEKLPEEVQKIIVKRAKIKTMEEKIAEQELEIEVVPITK
ncbi:MAG: hypothetical protein JRE23_02670 [Deltaproteobacteria bacterium]|nr:hypothetical protein [Deltaproteobacteria bacterium]